MRELQNVQIMGRDTLNVTCGRVVLSSGKCHGSSKRSLGRHLPTSFT